MQQTSPALHGIRSQKTVHTFIDNACDIECRIHHSVYACKFLLAVGLGNTLQFILLLYGIRIGRSLQNRKWIKKYKIMGALTWLCTHTHTCDRPCIMQLKKLRPPLLTTTFELFIAPANLKPLACVVMEIWAKMYPDRPYSSFAKNCNEHCYIRYTRKSVYS